MMEEGSEYYQEVLRQVEELLLHSPRESMALAESVVAASSHLPQSVASRLFLALGKAHLQEKEFSSAARAGMSAWNNADGETGEFRATIAACIGEINRKIPDYQSAILWLGRARDLYAESGNFRSACSFQHKIGSVFLDFDDYRNATTEFFKALETAEDYELVEEKISILNSIGVLYFKLQDFPKSLEYHTACLALKRATYPPDHKQVAIAYANLGVLGLVSGNIEEARKNCEHALDIYRRTNEIREIANTLGNLGRIYLRLGLIEKARECQTEALVIADGLEDKWLQTFLSINLGILHFEAKEFSVARPHFERALIYALASETKYWEREIRHYLAKILENLGEYREANEHIWRFAEISQEHSNTENRVEIAKLQAQRDLQSAEHEKEQLRRQLLQAEHQTFRSQMNPHFIFNALNSIQHFLLHSEKESANRFLTKFARLMRLILDNSRHSFVALENELDSLRLYLELETLRFGGKFHYEIMIDPALDEGEIFLPPMLIQPHVENAIWHGILPRSSGGTVSLTLRKINEETMECVIDDDGIGREAAAQNRAKSSKKHTSTALPLMQQRLELLQRSTGREMSVTVEDKYASADGEKIPAGTRISIILPILDESEKTL